MSGAGKIKGDATSQDGGYVEIKDANRSFTLSASALHKSWLEAIRNDHAYCEWIIKFNDPKIRVRLTVEME